MSRKNQLLLVIALLGSASFPAQAYLDPGTGSMLISAVLGVLATLGLALKTYWYKLVRLLRRQPAAPTEPKQPQSEQQKTKQDEHV